MGLSVTAYAGPIKRHTNQRDTSSGTFFYDNVTFPGRILPFRQGYHKVSDEQLDMFEGGCGSYAGWRNRLAQVAGFASVFDALKTEDGYPFCLQIYFSDQEGIIGTDACKVLAAEYEEYLPKAEELAKALGNQTFLEVYKEFAAGFKLAAETGGAVKYS